MAYPWPDQFTVAQSDVIEQMREKLSDAEIYIRWNHSVGKKLTGKTAAEVAAYLERNPRREIKQEKRG